jgi:hypothetical protein
LVVWYGSGFEKFVDGFDWLVASAELALPCADWPCRLPIPSDLPYQQEKLLLPNGTRIWIASIHAIIDANLKLWILKDLSAHTSE